MKIDYQSLSIDDRIRLVQDIWDSIAEEVATRELPRWQMRELDRRLEEIEKNPHDVQPWDEVKAEILSQKAQATPE